MPIEFDRLPDINEIKATAERIKPWVHRTPVVTCESINKIVGANLFFKCENFQKVGAFKFRGATNAVLSLTKEEGAKGVLTHSSGNHAQALSLAAAGKGYAAYIVMPETSPKVKKDAVAGYGGKITMCKPTLEARETTAEKVRQKTGATFVHPYDSYTIIAGQATAALELIADAPKLDIIMAPVGGGGLLSGAALSTHYFSHSAEVIAAEPKGADDAFRSMQAGRIIPSVKPDTIADGLLTSLGERNFDIIQKYVSQILTTGDEFIIKAMKLFWERAKIIIEPSAAVPLAALIENRPRIKGKNIGIILSGGNIDLNNLPWID